MRVTARIDKLLLRLVAADVVGDRPLIAQIVHQKTDLEKVLLDAARRARVLRDVALEHLARLLQAFHGKRLVGVHWLLSFGRFAVHGSRGDSRRPDCHQTCCMIIRLLCVGHGSLHQSILGWQHFRVLHQWLAYEPLSCGGGAFQLKQGLAAKVLCAGGDGVYIIS